MQHSFSTYFITYERFTNTEHPSPNNAGEVHKYQTYVKVVRLLFIGVMLTGFAIPTLADQTVAGSLQGKRDTHCISNTRAVPFELNEYQPDPTIATSIPTTFQVHNIRITRNNIFDDTDSQENNWLYRTANKLHFLSRERAIRNQLLFQAGESIDYKKIEESERRLRSLPYLYGAVIRIERICGNDVDVEVVTRDNWSLLPSASVKVAGGKNSAAFALTENNLFGYGKQLAFSHSEDDQRSKNMLAYGDNDFLNERLRLFAAYGSNTDGNDKILSLSNPWISVDDPDAWDISYLSTLLSRQVYEQQGGAELNQYDHKKRKVSVSYGISRPAGTDYTYRYTLGYTDDDNLFSQNNNSIAPNLIPSDRRLSYPWLQWSFTSTRFQKKKNHHYIDVIEDVYVGSEGALKLGYSSQSLGAEFNAFVYELGYRVRLIKEQKNLLFLNLKSDGFIESGKHSITNGLNHTGLEYYLNNEERSSWYFEANYDHGNNLALDRQLLIGGARGLRGYPADYQSGNRRVVAQIEKRYFSDIHLFRLLRFGFVFFVDTGRAWTAENSQHNPWLSDVGMGIRLASSRVFNESVLHIDLATPTGKQPKEDNLQLTIEASNRF